MAHITNLSSQALVVNGKDDNGVIVQAFLTPRMKKEGDEEVIDKRSEMDVPDKIAKAWSKKTTVSHMIRAGEIKVTYGDAEVASDDLLERIATITDPDELEAMAADETRQPVIEALVTRLGKIS
jgi:hypothetical protein